MAGSKLGECRVPLAAWVLRVFTAGGKGAAGDGLRNVRGQAGDREEVTARAVGNVVLVEGKVNMTVVVEGVEKNLYNRYLGVWTAVSGKLLLTAWASTKLN